MKANLSVWCATGMKHVMREALTSMSDSGIWKNSTDSCILK